MISAVPDILARIVAHKATELAETQIPLNVLERRAEVQVQHRRSFRAALESHTPALIAEIKKASPSKGLLAIDFRPAEIASAYAEGGASALSVLTDRQFFQGSLQDLEIARSAVKLPVLRKDFTTAEYHVVEAAAHRADAILLIAAVLSAQKMRTLRELAAVYRMDALIEVHNAAELDAAIESGAEIIGVNNRDLHTFEVNIATSLELAPRMPKGALLVSESGIRTKAQITELQAAGYRAFLVGEHLMKSGDPRSAVEALLR